MSDKVDLKIATPKGYTRTDRVTEENIEDWAASLNGTLEEGKIFFKIHEWEHSASVGDWIVVFFPFGDLQVYSDAMFNRIFEVPEAV